MIAAVSPAGFIVILVAIIWALYGLAKWYDSYREGGRR
jgi:hypothetical protein